MTGLLGNGWDDPKSSAIMALAGGLLQGNFGGGLLGASNAMSEAKQNAMKKQYMDMQIQNMQSEIEARKLKTIQDQRKQDLISGVFGSGGVGAPQVSPGAFTPSPSQAGPMGPVMPPSMGGMAAPGSRLANLGFDELARLKLADVDLTELHKYANDPRKLEGGSTYENRVTGNREFIPKMPEGMSINNGRASFVPGYQDSLVNLESSRTAATEGVRAGMDLVKVVGEDGAERYVTRAQAVSAAQPPAQRPPAVMPQPQPSQNKPTGAYVGDPQVVLAAINDIKNPAERQAARQAYEQQFGPLQASPSTAQVSNAAAAKETAVQVAKDVAEQRKAIMNAGFNAPTNIAKYQQIGRLLSDVDGGKFTPAGTEVASALNSLGVKVDKNLPNKEAAAAMANEAALQLRNPAGGAGMPGAMSDADRQFLASMTPSMTQSKEGRNQVISAYVAVQQRNQQVAQFARNYEKKYGKLDNGFFDQLQAWSSSNPLFKGR